jgi:hypothetical protein
LRTQQIHAAKEKTVLKKVALRRFEIQATVIFKVLEFLPWCVNQFHVSRQSNYATHETFPLLFSQYIFYILFMFESMTDERTKKKINFQSVLFLFFPHTSFRIAFSCWLLMKGESEQE